MSTSDQITTAQLHGQALHCVHKQFTVDNAVTSLREISTRPDLLAEAAGILAGTADPETGERPWRITAARFLVLAGADRTLLPGWIERGRRNVARPVGWGTAREWPDDLAEVLADVLAGVDGPPLED